METRTEAKVTRLKTAAASLAVVLLIAACSAGVAEHGTHTDAPEVTATSMDMPEEVDHGGMDMPEVHDEEAEEGHGDEHGEEADDDHGTMEMRTIEITAGEFAFSPSSIHVEEGETITFVVTNDGVAPHEFEVTAAGDRDGHEHSADHAGTSESKLVLDPGETGTLTVTFDGEVDEIVCLIPGHYEAGMLLEIHYGGSYQPITILP